MTENKSQGYWKILDESESIPLINAYRAEENTIVKHHSPLTAVFVDMAPKGRMTIQQISLSDNVTVRAIWQGGDDSLAEPATLQRHDCFELIYVIRGEIETLIEDGRFLFKQGDAFLLNRYTRNALIFHEMSEIVVICMAKDYWANGQLKDGADTFHHKKISHFFTTNTTNEFYDNRDYVEFRRISETNRDNISSVLLNQLKDEMKLRAPGYTHVARGFALRFLMFLDDPNHYKTTYISLGPSTDKNLVEDIKSFMEKKPRKISQQEISEVFHFSIGYLASIFKKYTGQTLSEYNQNIYLLEAKRLLLYSELSVSEISEQIGYASRTQFYKMFEEKYKMAPKQYRKANLIQ